MTLSPKVLADIRRHTTDMAKALEVKGLMNVQYAIKDDEVYVLEVNPRASRTVPFASKAIGGAAGQGRGSRDGRGEGSRTSASPRRSSQGT